MFNLNREQFNNLSNSYNLIPLYRQYMADTETPASLFLKIRKKCRPVFLLESIEGPKGLSRYSIIGVDYSRIISYSGGIFTIEEKNGAQARKKTGRPLEYLRELIGRTRVYKDPELEHFIGGTAGYISYDMVKYFEGIPLYGKPEFPEMLLYCTSLAVVFDHYRNTLKIIASLFQKDSDNQKIYSRSAQLIENLEEIIFSSQGIYNHMSQLGGERKGLQLRSNFTPQQFMAAVERAKNYINQGEAFQVVVSQRFEINKIIDDFELYRSLRTTNPSPYMFFMDFDDFKLIGSSPEPLVKVEGETVLTCPIAGTRKRGSDELKDRILARELLSDKKERAEHNMLVDLARNDLGRVCRYGSVNVKSYMQVQRYSHVMHLVSWVEGKITEKKDVFDVLKSVFPAGTLSGAPKVRAMQIISELERQRRGPYGGAVGYFGYDGSMDFCITIRTAVLKRDNVYIQAGAGIVQDSIAQKEYEETVNKARALLESAQISRCKGGVKC